MTAAHQCDPSIQPMGGLITLHRVYRTLADVLNSRPPSAVTEVDHCPECRRLLTLNLAAHHATIVSAINPDIRMGYELQLAAVQAALDRGEVDTPPEGFGV